MLQKDSRKSIKKIYYYQTKIGNIGIVEEDGFIVEVTLGRITSYKVEETNLIRKTYQQLEEYLNGKRKKFTMPIHLSGTEFEKSVYQALLKIPYGETRSYQDIAIQIGNPNACRAVGMANHKNKLMILVPCHRVIGKNQKLVGYAGGIEIKEKLLELEKNYYNE